MTQQMQPGLTKGTVEKTACPHCKRPLNFRDVDDYGVEQGAVLECEHCKGEFEIVRVAPVTVLWLKAVPKGTRRF